MNHDEPQHLSNRQGLAQLLCQDESRAADLGEVIKAGKCHKTPKRVMQVMLIKQLGMFDIIAVATGPVSDKTKETCAAPLEC